MLFLGSLEAPRGSYMFCGAPTEAPRSPWSRQRFPAKSSSQEPLGVSRTPQDTQGPQGASIGPASQPLAIAKQCWSTHF